jgi:selenocysteine lyase/cysteine desulfurase
MLAHSLIYGLGASVEMMLEIGPAAIEQRVMELAGRTRQMLESHGGEFLEGEHYRSPILAPKFPGRDASLLAQLLKQAGVLVSARYGRLRVSTHFYNDENDIDRLSEELKRLRQ